MEIRLSRLRAGEIVAGASGVLLAVFMFAAPWYGVRTDLSSTANSLGVSSNFNGWQALTHVRWLLVITILAAVALAYFQASRQAPAIPVSLSVIVTVLGFVTVLVLVYRVLINVPGQDSLVDAKLGAYLGLLSSLGILCGAFVSMRQEGISPHDAPAEIETVRSSTAAGS